MMFADLDKSVEVEVTQLPEPINGLVFEAHLRYFETLAFNKDAKRSEYVGLFETVDEATEYAKGMVESELEKRRKAKEYADLKARYVSKMTYRIHN